MLKNQVYIRKKLTSSLLIHLVHPSKEYGKTTTMIR